MATRSAALPIERNYLAKAWFVVAAVVLVAVTAITIALAGGSGPAGGSTVDPVRDYGPVDVQQQSIEVNGSVCGQCR